MHEVVKVASLDRVQVVKMDMCAFGMTTKDKEGEGLVRKTTKMMTNGPEVAIRIARRCTNTKKGEARNDEHRHVMLINGRARQAQVYPRALCRAICEGVSAQKKMDCRNRVLIDAMSMEELYAMGVDELHEDVEYEAFDDVSGEPLEPGLVKAAGKKEFKYFVDMGVYEYATIEDCCKITGIAPIGTRWIDINKGDSKKVNYRSRLVAKEFRVDVRPEFLRLLLSRAADDNNNNVLCIDVSRAHFYAKAIRPTFIKLPAEDPRSGENIFVEGL